MTNSRAKGAVTLPWPPSVNQYWRTFKGRMLLSAKGREYRQTVLANALAERFPKYGDSRMAVEIVAYPPDRRRRDLDNLLKGLLDAMQAAGVYDDDSQIDSLCIRREAVTAGGKVEVYLEAA